MRYVSYYLFSRVSNKIRRWTGTKRFSVAEIDWLWRMSEVNRCYLAGPSMHYILEADRERRVDAIDHVIKLRLAGIDARYRYLWPVGLNALGAEWNYRLHGISADLCALIEMFDKQIDSTGRWLSPISFLDCAFKGYSLLFLAQVTGEQRYVTASHILARYLLDVHPRAEDGSLVYDCSSNLVLVDSLGMVSPFLARFARQFEHPGALELSLGQLTQFIETNVDRDTHLPYHGYYPDGAKHLGLHGWGRGTGWFMLGLVDTLAETPHENPAYSQLAEAFRLAADSVCAYQRLDGHWNWAILHREERFDSSTTAMIGYSLVRGMQLGVLNDRFFAPAAAAIAALVSVTGVDGQVEGGLGECLGLGRYPQTYGKQQWLQGASVAFASVFLQWQYRLDGHQI